MRMSNYNNGQRRNRNPFEWFLDRCSVPNLSLVIVLCYGFGYLLEFVNASFLNYLTLNPYEILHGQIWRLITWVLLPPGSSNLFLIFIAMLFYYSIGNSLERAWGTRAFNAYIWTGIGLTIAGAFLAGGILWALLQGQSGLTEQAITGYYAGMSRYFSTYYVSTSIFLAYAMTFPDAVVLLWFIIPMKVKWMGVVYGVMIAVDFVQAARIGGLSGLYTCISMAASLANFVIFWLRSRKLHRFAPGEIRRRKTFRQAVQKGQQTSSGGTVRMHPGHSVARHRCAICGKTELDDPTAEFRYCSKCQNSYEFCQDHLFSHRHAVNGSPPLPAEDTITIEKDAGMSGEKE